MRVTLTGQYQTVYEGQAAIQNNSWGVDLWGFDDWVRGRDYAQTITYTPGDMLTGLVARWHYPSTEEGHILGYPEVIIGFKPWDQVGSRFLIGRADDLKTLTVTADVDIWGDTERFNISYDLWLTDSPTGHYSTITAEVMIWLHAGALDDHSTPVATLRIGEATARIFHQPAMSSGTDQTWSYTAVVLDRPMLEGTVDVAHILRMLERRGFIDGDDYLTSMEFGAEVQHGSGGYRLNRMTWDHARFRITEGADRVQGTDGGDWIRGRDGPDSLNGWAGADTLEGGRGADHLSGDRGRDVLNGGRGTDLLTGGSGADRFVFAEADRAGPEPAPRDRITDFRPGLDRIDLRGLDGDRIAEGDQPLALIGARAFSGTPGELRLKVLRDHAALLADTDGDGRADWALRLDGVTALAPGDLLL
ncbi:hypothetical protein E7811_00540 [Aliigemmobacter aestuarii]|uniref:Peptidase M10 serralysin C-terminal domain-containing protein n=1 Tax=Aliigemmobacter aestuarii TaxID=1445661 RepID=A0A4S3MPC5_9RHOB|nr:hypothetical protein [Gemmobacter aestuarii]THD84278.1 hypothetical protein E7811_00540 [Gemmobacter aestuarii]